jgi:hypothetical protein
MRVMTIAHLASYALSGEADERVQDNPDNRPGGTSRGLHLSGSDP